MLNLSDILHVFLFRFLGKKLGRRACKLKKFQVTFTFIPILEKNEVGEFVN